MWLTTQMSQGNLVEIVGKPFQKALVENDPQVNATHNESKEENKSNVVPVRPLAKGCLKGRLLCR